MKKLIAIMLTLFTVFSLSFPTVTFAREYSKDEIREIVHQLKEEDRQAEREEERRATARKDKDIEWAQGAAMAKLTERKADLAGIENKMASLDYLTKVAKFLMLPVAGIGFIASVLYFHDNPKVLAAIGTAFNMFARMFLNEKNINFNLNSNT